MSLQKKSHCKFHYKENLIVNRITKEILWQRSRISLGHDPADTCPQRTICKINSNCDSSVGPVGELIKNVLHFITKEILSQSHYKRNHIVKFITKEILLQISWQRKSYCKSHDKRILIVNIITKEILLYISWQKKSHCKCHYKGNPIVNLMTKEILL